LSGDGVCVRIQEKLVKEFNLHAIVRLPNGGFAPDADMPPANRAAKQGCQTGLAHFPVALQDFGHLNVV